MEDAYFSFLCPYQLVDRYETGSFHSWTCMSMSQKKTNHVSPIIPSVCVGPAFLPQFYSSLPQKSLIFPSPTHINPANLQPRSTIIVLFSFFVALPTFQKPLRRVQKKLKIPLKPDRDPSRRPLQINPQDGLHHLSLFAQPGFCSVQILRSI